MCNCKVSCPLLAIAASIIIGVITAFLQITAVITVTPAFLWVVLGIAVTYLAVLLASSSKICGARCCTTLSTLLTGILGAALVSVVLLGITFAATSIIGAVITGLLLAFLSLILTSTTCLVKCLADCDN